jgi:hypothetical protein
MKTNFFKHVALLLLLAGCFLSCNKKENSNEQNVTQRGVSWYQLNSAPLAVVSKENLPEWLFVMIEEIENINSDDFDMINVQIFMGEWKNNTVYYVYNSFNSCLFCDIYYDDGTNMNFTLNNDLSDFLENSEKWVIIYEFGDGLCNL